MNRTLPFLGMYLVLLVMIITMTVFQKPLLSISNSIIVPIQISRLNLIAFFFSYPVLFGGLGLYIFYLVFASHDRIRAVYDTLFIIGGAGLVALLKLIFKEHRPYMDSDGPKCYDCECDYGYPSGHAFFIVSTLWLWFDKFFRRNQELFLCELGDSDTRRNKILGIKEEVQNEDNGLIRVYNKEEDREILRQSMITDNTDKDHVITQLSLVEPYMPESKAKYVFAAFAFITIFSVCFSRMYLGVHSLTQVLGGICAGTIYSHLLLVSCYDYAFNWLKSAMERKFNKRAKILTTLTMIIIIVVFNGAAAAILFWNTETLPDDYCGIWKQRVEFFCPSCIKKQKFLAWKDYKDSVFFNIVPVSLAILALLPRKPYERNNKFFVDQTTRTKLLRLLVYILVEGAGGAMLLTEIFVTNQTIILVIRFATAFTFPVFFFLLAPIGFKIMKVEVNGDIINLAK